MITLPFDLSHYHGWLVGPTHTIESASQSLVPWDGESLFDLLLSLYPYLSLVLRVANAMTYAIREDAF
jgi:hypothetical protein